MGDFLYTSLLEYLSNEDIYLKNYINMSKSDRMHNLPFEYYEFFEDFTIETGSDFEIPKEYVKSDYMDEDDVEVDMFENNTYELIEQIYKNDKTTYNEFAEYLYDKINNFYLPIEDQDYPAQAYFNNGAKILKNQQLIHFTNKPKEIANKGFEYGVSDANKLGLTRYLDISYKLDGGYNFAYVISDIHKYAEVRKGLYKYGTEAVIFRASGIKVWHDGDKEEQVIFQGKNAKDIVPITKGEKYQFAVYNKKGRLLYENDDMLKVVNQITNNYIQYHKNI